MIYQQVNFSQFCDSFSDTYKNSFSYEGKRALYDYLEQLSDDTGDDIELDTVALCCEFSEHESALDCANQYIQFEQEEQTNEYALEWLREQTQVIEVEGKTNIIIQEF